MRCLAFASVCVVLLVQNVFGQCDTVTVENTIVYKPFDYDYLIEADGLRNGPEYDQATLYYPKNNDNNLKPIVLVPGHSATQQSISAWAKYLASRGFICMTIGTNSLWDFTDKRADALLDGMETIRQENNRSNSPLYQRIDTDQIAVGGWSMGGGGAQLAAKKDSKIKAILAIAPWLRSSTLSESDLDHNTPLLIISGQIDPTSPPLLHANLHYDYTPSSTSKLLFEIELGDHYTPLYPSTGRGDVGNIAFAWFKLFLDENKCYCDMLNSGSLDLNNKSSKYEIALNCKTLNIDKTFKPNLNLNVYPVPATNEINVEFNSSKKTDYKIYNVFGQQLKNGIITAYEKINIESLPHGIYYLKVGQTTIRFIKE